MKTINLFIASSIREFYRERLLLGEFIRRSNIDSFRPRGFQISLFLCEDEFLNSQPTYDRYIRRSDIFIAIIGQHLGKYTSHEIEVSSNAETIKRRIIVSTGAQNTYKTADGFLYRETNKESLLSELETIIESAASSIIDEIPDVEYQANANSYVLGIPLPSDCLEFAVIGNIIRRYEDQEYAIRVVNNSCNNNCDSHVVLLSTHLASEVQRIEHLLSLSGIQDYLWLFLSESAAREMAAIVLKVENTGNHPDFFSTLEDLSLIFENRLLRSLLNNNPGRFHYLFEDHVLFREYLPSKKRTLVKNLLDGNTVWFEDSVLTVKERIICSILNLYNSTNLLDKHQEALYAIKISNYDYFCLKPELIKELPLKSLSDNVRDYIIDSIVNIYKSLDSLSYNQVLVDVNQIIESIQDNQMETHLTLEDQVFIYSACGELLSYNVELYPEATEFLLRAVSLYFRLPNNTLFQNSTEQIKRVVIVLVHIYFDKHNIGKIRDIITQFESFDNDDVFIATLLAYKALISNKREEAKRWYEIAEQKIQAHANEDNEKLNLYLQIRCTNLLSDVLSDNSWGDYVETRVRPLAKQGNDLYSNYLKNLHYPVTEGWIKILQSVLNKDIDGIDLAINLLKENTFNWQWEKISSDVLYCKTKILEDLGEYELAINVLHDLYVSAYNDDDKALYKQNIALNYMNMYETEDNLKKAENNYKEAYELFTKSNQSWQAGNVLDGLSYCSILQKRFSDAEYYSSLAMKIPEYDCDNKHCNYISSLLCQKKYVKALYHFYIRCQGNDTIRRLMINDWESEMKVVGIDTSCFKLLFRR